MAENCGVLGIRGIFTHFFAQGRLVSVFDFEYRQNEKQGPILYGAKLPPKSP
jgi:hypothetical protein